MQKIAVKGDRGYEILLEKGIVKEAGDYIRKVTKATRAIVISDSNVFPIFLAITARLISEASKPKR